MPLDDEILQKKRLREFIDGDIVATNPIRLRARRRGLEPGRPASGLMGDPVLRTSPSTKTLFRQTSWPADRPGREKAFRQSQTLPSTIASTPHHHRPKAGHRTKFFVNRRARLPLLTFGGNSWPARLEAGANAARPSKIPMS